MRNRRILLASLVATCLALQAWAQQRSPVGDWVGEVSWNELRIIYSWEINPDGSFNSGRINRGLNGDGVWSVQGDRLILKYGDGFRYDGTFTDDAYSGSAHYADGRLLGTFSMWRAPADDAAATDE